MDWAKTINTVFGVAWKTGILAVSLVLVMTSLVFIYVAALALLWFTHHAERALGS